jgi:transposase
LPVVRLPGGVRPADHGLQPLQPRVAAGLLAQAAGRAGRYRRGDPEHRDRQHLHQGPALRVRWKRGARAQAIGRSRGGQTTKLHALTDVIGRPYALILTPGHVADVKAAPELLARLGRARYLLADKGYDADALRRSLRQTGIVPVIPGRRNRNRAIRYEEATLPRPPPRRERLLPAPRTSAAWQLDTTSSPPTSSQVWHSLRSAVA